MRKSPVERKQSFTQWLIRPGHGPGLVAQLAQWARGHLSLARFLGHRSVARWGPRQWRQLAAHDRNAPPLALTALDRAEREWRRATGRELDTLPPTARPESIPVPGCSCWLN